MKNRIKISWNDVVEINHYKQKHLRDRLLCAHFLYRYETGSGCYFKQYSRAKWLVYLLLLLPVLLWEFFGCLWDGGLRSFVWPSIEIHNYPIISSDASFGYCMELWNEG